MNDTIVKITVLIYDFMLVVGTAYLVQVHNWSMWTFLLAVIFFMTAKSTE